jgi:hypothetical protein
MRSRKNKGPLRNFHFLKEADDTLLRLANDTGRDMVGILEDLLLNRRQFSPATDPSVAARARTPGPEPAWHGSSARVAVDEALALAMLSLDKRQPAAARKAFWRFRRMNNIKTLPGGVYSVRAIERACG